MVELGLAGSDSAMRVTPLSGGVASDIAAVDLGENRYCVKFALPKLKVAEDWRAPVHRNRAEYAWLQVASQVAPESAVRLFGRSGKLYGFAMEQYGHIPEMQDMERLHAQMHAVIKDVVKFKNAGRETKAETAFVAVGPLSEQIVQLLKRVEDKVDAG